MESTQEILDSYEFKIVKRILMRDYPFIKEIEVDPEHHLWETLLFMNVYVDADKYEKYMGHEIDPTRRMMIDRFYRGTMPLPHPSSVFSDPEAVERADKMEREIENKLKKLHNSEIIPNDLKLTRSPRVGTMFVQTK